MQRVRFLREEGGVVEAYTSGPDGTHPNFALGVVKNGVLHITHTRVLKDERGRGLGRKLVDKLIHETKPVKVKAAMVLPEAVGFWHNMGISDFEESLATEIDIPLMKYINR